jgi:amidase
VNSVAAKSRRPRAAFVPHDLATALKGAVSGPLAGLTAAVKDMYDIAGARTGGGNPEWLLAHPPAAANARAVQKILDAGATVIGKTVCDEFFFSVTGANAHYGTPLNPRAPGRLPGGSSSGSASATASGACDFALGSDTGGSVRVPAALCGLFGIRPTHGRVELSGAMPMAPSFDVAGWFASGPGVFRSIGQVLLEGDRRAAPIGRMILLDDALAEADPEVAALLQAFLADAADHLPKPEHARIAPQGLDPWRECFRVIQGWEIWSSYGEFITRERPRLGPGIKERMEYAAKISEREAETARREQMRAREQVREMASPGTILVLPTAPSIAPLIDASTEALDSFRSRVMRLTSIAGLSGLPQITLPAGTIDGCPVGLSFIAWSGGDEALLDLAFGLAKHGGIERQGDRPHR